jgi:RimJ/RimL family protein N-acetyltransferase
VALSDIDRVFRTGRLWYVLGDKRFAGRGLTSRAVADLVREGFGPVRLEAINAWAVVENRPSIRILESNGFRLIGYQRRCHRIDGRPVDRALFDLLATEFEGGPGVPPPVPERAATGGATDACAESLGS